MLRSNLSATWGFGEDRVMPSGIALFFTVNISKTADLHSIFGKSKAINLWGFSPQMGVYAPAFNPLCLRMESSPRTTMVWES